MRKKILGFVAVVCLLAFLTPVSGIKASSKKYSGTYKGTWKAYAMTCPKVYNNFGGSLRLKMKVKKNGKMTGKIKFNDGNYYKVTGLAKNKKIKLHFTYDTLSIYDYYGSIKKSKIKMYAFNNDANGNRKCLSGWKQIIKAKKQI